MTQGTPDFLAKLRKQVDAPPAVTSAQVAAVTQAQTFEPSAAAAMLPPWATAKVDPLHARPTLAPWAKTTTGANAPVAINPPESALPPAPAIGIPVAATTLVAATAQPEPAKRTRRTKAEMEAARAADGSGQVAVHPAVNLAADALRDEGVTVADATQVGPRPALDEIAKLSYFCRLHGVKRLAFMSGQVHEIELFKAGEAPVGDKV